MVKTLGKKEITDSIVLTPISAPSAETGKLYFDTSASKLKVSLDGATFKIALDESDIGTTANKLVQLDGTAKLPAVDGSNLTGVLTTANLGVSISKIASDTIQNSSDSEDHTPQNTTAYYKLKTFTFTNGLVGTYRISFHLRAASDGTGGNCSARIYKNGIAFGTERSVIADQFVGLTFTEDFEDLNAGDTLEIWARTHSASWVWAYIKEYRLKYDDATQKVAVVNS